MLKTVCSSATTCPSRFPMKGKRRSSRSSRITKMWTASSCRSPCAACARTATPFSSSPKLETTFPSTTQNLKSLPRGSESPSLPPRRSRHSRLRKNPRRMTGAKQFSAAVSFRRTSGVERFLSKLRLRAQVCLAAGEVNGNRNVFMRNQPFAANLAITIGDPHGEVHFGAVFTCHHQVLNAVCVPQLAVGRDVEIRKLKLLDLSRKGGEELLKVLLISIRTNVLTRRNHVEDSELCSGRVPLHDGLYILRLEGCHKAIFKRSYFLRVFCRSVASRPGAITASGEQHCDHPQS